MNQIPGLKMLEKANLSGCVLSKDLAALKLLFSTQENNQR
jgi:hypothetical protein